MSHDDRREIFERLEALERLARSRHERGGDWDDHRHGGRVRGHRHGRHHHHEHHEHHGDCDHDGDRGGGDFEEKRIIDTIVRLVTERVGRIVQDQQARSQRHDDGGGEKRIVDLIVGLVSEHVQEIVATELDRRLGRPEARCDEHPPLPPARGGAPDSEPS